MIIINTKSSDFCVRKALEFLQLYIHHHQHKMYDCVSRLKSDKYYEFLNLFTPGFINVNNNGAKKKNKMRKFDSYRFLR